MRIIYLKCKFLLQSCIPGKSKCLFLLRHHFLTIQQTDTQFYFLTGIIAICQINDRPYNYSRTSEPVLLDGGDREETVVTQTAYPTYRGALVVCQGGDRADVKLAVTAAVSALTGLSSDRVTVVKCQ